MLLAGSCAADVKVSIVSYLYEILGSFTSLELKSFFPTTKIQLIFEKTYPVGSLLNRFF